MAIVKFTREEKVANLIKDVSSKILASMNWKEGDPPLGENDPVILVEEDAGSGRQRWFIVSDELFRNFAPEVKGLAAMEAVKAHLGDVNMIMRVTQITIIDWSMVSGLGFVSSLPEAIGARAKKAFEAWKAEASASANTDDPKPKRSFLRRLWPFGK
jgi:hypothetical protein